MRALWAIAKNAFAELTRQPIYGILVLVGMALIAFSPLIAMFTYMQDIKLVVDMGLGTIFMMGMALAVLCATQVVSREIEAKTAGAVMSKPVGRLTFVAGKFLGVSMAMAMAGYLFTLILLNLQEFTAHRHPGVGILVNHVADHGLGGIELSQRCGQLQGRSDQNISQLDRLQFVPFSGETQPPLADTEQGG